MPLRARPSTHPAPGQLPWSWRLRTATSVAVAATGVLLAAAAAQRGGFLARDVEVGRPPLLVFPRIDLGRGGRAADSDPLAAVGTAFEILVRVLLVVVLLLVVAAVAYVFVRGLAGIRAMLLRRSSADAVPTDYDPGEQTDEASETALRQRLTRAVAVGDELLEEAADPTEAVLACYAAMERAAADAGTGRLIHETPHELLRRVLAEQRVSADNAHELTVLYEQVRYGARRPDVAMRERARRCLTAIRAELVAAR